LLAALNGGITTVCDNAHICRTPAHADASVQALQDAGIRGVHAYGRPRHGAYEGFPHDASRLRETYFASGDQLTTMRMFMLGRDPHAEMMEVLKVRRSLDLWITFDSGIGEQPVVDLYRETINHGTFVAPEKKAAIVAHGAQVNVCPRIETQFRYGHVPYEEWVAAGAQPAISNDDPATYALDMFREMQTLYGYQRAQAFRAAAAGGEPRFGTLREMLRAATLQGAHNCALGERTGSLTPGKQADIVLIRADSMHLYPRNNALCTVVQAAGVDSVDTVLVAGRVAKWRGRLVGVDLTRLRAAMDESRDYLFGAAAWPLGKVDVTG
jgi:cytosine/adenosine deaminase-related metal-dependent hydrolase